MPKNNKTLLWFFFAGMIFLANPVFAVIDVLPDFLGCAFIFYALSRASALSSGVKEVRTAFSRLLILQAARFVLSLLSLRTGQSESATLLLTVTFAFGALSLLFLIPALIRLKNATPAFCAAHGGSFSEACDKRGRNRFDRYIGLCVWFFIVKELLTVLPEFTALSLSSDVLNGRERLYDFIGLLRFLALAVIFVLFVYFTVRSTLVLRLVRSDTELFAAVGREYDLYIAEHPLLLSYRRNLLSLSFFFAGALMWTDFYIDFHNVIPDVVAAALILAGILVSPLPGKKKIPAAVFSVFYGVAAFFSGRFAYRFSTKFDAFAIDKNQLAARAYFEMWISSFVEFLIFLALLSFLLLFLREIVRRYAGYIPEHASEFEDKKRKELLEAWDKRLLRLVVVGFIAALASFLFDYIQVIPNFKFSVLLEYFWVFDFLLSLAFALSLGNAFLSLQTDLQDRIRYD